MQRKPVTTAAGSSSPAAKAAAASEASLLVDGLKPKCTHFQGTRHIRRSSIAESHPPCSGHPNGFSPDDTRHFAFHYFFAWVAHEGFAEICHLTSRSSLPRLADVDSNSAPSTPSRWGKIRVQSKQQANDRSFHPCNTVTWGIIVSSCDDDFQYVSCIHPSAPLSLLQQRP
mmetsp:Transcript_25964/g.56384  ORF Transcript_25964/g.56384 Transcript_25964/m.56384 type:complete len:171 (-) Transcript_25964:1468-1980(-)